MRDKTILFNAIFIIESVIFSFVTYKLLVVFRLNFYIHTIFSAVEKVNLTMYARIFNNHRHQE